MACERESYTCDEDGECGICLNEVKIRQNCCVKICAECDDKIKHLCPVHHRMGSATRRGSTGNTDNVSSLNIDLTSLNTLHNSGNYSATLEHYVRSMRSTDNAASSRYYSSYRTLNEVHRQWLEHARSLSGQNQYNGQDEDEWWDDFIERLGEEDRKSNESKRSESKYSESKTRERTRRVRNTFEYGSEADSDEEIEKLDESDDTAPTFNICDSHNVCNVPGCLQNVTFPRMSNKDIMKYILESGDTKLLEYCINSVKDVNIQQFVGRRCSEHYDMERLLTGLKNLGELEKIDLSGIDPSSINLPGTHSFKS